MLPKPYQRAAAGLAVLSRPILLAAVAAGALTAAERLAARHAHAQQVQEDETGVSPSADESQPGEDQAEDAAEPARAGQPDDGNRDTDDGIDHRDQESPPEPAASHEQYDAIKRALLDKAAALRTDWRKRRGYVPRALHDLDQRIQAADEPAEYRQLISLLAEWGAKTADKRRARLVRQLDDLERTLWELDGRVPEELHALRARVLDDQEPPANDLGRGEQDQPQSERVVVVKRLNRQLQDAIQRTLDRPARPPLQSPDAHGDPNQQDPIGQESLGPDPLGPDPLGPDPLGPDPLEQDLLGDPLEAGGISDSPDEQGGPRPSTTPSNRSRSGRAEGLARRMVAADRLAGLDLVRLAEAYSDARTEADVARARLEQLNQANTANPGTIPDSELAIEQLRYEGAERKVRLLRAVAAAARQTSQPDQARALDAIFDF